MPDVITQEVVSSQKAKADELYGIFSERHAERLAAEENRDSKGRLLANLKAAARQAWECYTKARRDVILALPADPSIISKAPDLRVLCDSAELMEGGHAYYDAGDFADAEGQVWVALIAELEAQVEFESSRLAHHERAFELALAAAAELEATLTVEVAGGKGDQLRSLIARITNQLTHARTQLKEHDRATAEKRAALATKEAA